MPAVWKVGVLMTQLASDPSSSGSRLPRMSHSRYAQYARCGEEYRLARIERVPVTPSIYAVAGTAFHEWTDYYDTSPPWDTEISHEDWFASRIEELISEEQEKSGFALKEWGNPDLRALGKWRADQVAVATKGVDPTVPHPNEKVRDEFQSEIGPDMIRKYIEWRANTAWSIAQLEFYADHREPGIEFEVTFDIHGVENIAKIDRIFQIPETGELVAIDTKTWSRKRVTSQLPTYLVALRQAGFNVMGAGYYEARRGTTTPIQTFRYWDEDRLAALHAQAAHMIQAGFFLPNPSDNCRMCDVRNHCLWFLE